MKSAELKQSIETVSAASTRASRNTRLNWSQSRAPADVQIEVLASLRKVVESVERRPTKAKKRESHSEKDAVKAAHETAAAVIRQFPPTEVKAAEDAESIFDMLGRSRDENLHSDALAALLNPFRVGPAAKTLFAAMMELGRGRPVIDPKQIDCLAVYREFRLDNFGEATRRGSRDCGRLDIFARSNNGVLVIENKVDATEGLGQTQDYCDVVEARYGESARPRTYLLLAPSTLNARSELFCSVSYRRLFGILVALRGHPGWTRAGGRLLRLYIDELATTFVAQGLRAAERSINLLRRAGYAI